jgi:multidrug efflux pump subunit AcrB
MEKLKFKEFKPTSWSIDNKTSVYVLTFIIAVFGLTNYFTIPKEQFPEIVIPQIIVSTIYPGTSPADIENLITRPLEKNMKSINGVKKITSKSVQDYSLIIAEFNTDVEVADAKQKVKDAVDKTKQDLPSNLLEDPFVQEINLSDFPIMYLNISGNYDLAKLKKFAEDLQDRIESFPEITRVDIVGALDREIQINVDMYKMQAAKVTFYQIAQAIGNENMTIPGGTINMQSMTRSIRVVGEYKNIDQIKNTVLISNSGAIVYLKDIAEVKDGFKDQESYSRFNGKNVITLNVIKKSGKNLLDASDKIEASIAEFKNTKFPSDLEVNITGNQAKFTRSILTELNNTIIIGFILVTIVLMFFMGVTNAIFVGLSVPLSMALAYIFMPWIDFTMNMLVMFSFIFALGIVVDDAIVVIENTHRIFKKENGRMTIKEAAKNAAGEVFLPVLSGTLTTLAPFFPLAFWPGVVGSFMFYIPVTIIITLTASLIVAYIINPVFAVDFMKHDEDHTVKLHQKKAYKNGAIIIAIAAFFYILGGFKFGSTMFGIGTFLVIVAILYVGHNTFWYKIIHKFQNRVIPGLMARYDRVLRWAIEGKRPYKLLWGTFILLIVSFILTGIAGPKVVFFPDETPKTIMVYAKLPVGTRVEYTDSIAKEIEKRVTSVLGATNPDVESVVTNVAFGASEDQFDGGIVTSNKAKVAINFVEYSKRTVNYNTMVYMNPLREAMKDIAGAEITVDKNQDGPPTGKPINIEISAEDLDELISTTDRFIRYLDSINIPGIEKYKTDFQKTKPEIIVDIDRLRANHEGISSAQVGSAINTAVLGTETSKYRDGEDQYPIQLRFSKSQREDVDKLINMEITYRDMNSGMLRSIPLSSLATVKYQNSVGGINRTDLKRVITITSNVLDGYNANEIVSKIKAAVPEFQKSDKIDIKLTGEQEDQAETMAFLSKAMMLALFLILFILITQFNSFGKTAIILSEVIFSVIGVLLGFTIFNMTFSIIMTGMGIVALAGIVVRNGILLVEFTDVLKERGLRTREAIIQAGKTRITPVILTATAAILGLIPLAVGFNIDFASLFTHLNPHIHFGGDNAMFFGPLAWTIIFGLIFATFLTLILIPVMYFITYSGKVKLARARHRSKIETMRELEDDELNEY